MTPEPAKFGAGESLTPEELLKAIQAKPAANDAAFVKGRWRAAERVYGDVMTTVDHAVEALASAKAKVEEAERCIDLYHKMPNDVIVLWARQRPDGSINSQTLRTSREGVERAAHWDSKRGRIVRLLAKVVPE